MRVLVLLPTTGALNRVLRIEARDDLPASSVYAQHDFRPLAITSDYDALTSKAGPLAALAPLVKAGAHRLLLGGPIEAGKSWELPVLLAHLAVALGAELVAEPAEADIVLWSTGAVDLDLHIVAHDYKLRAKAGKSQAALKQAAASGARIIALVPACEDASPLRDLLAEAGAQHGRVETIDGVGAARVILEQALRPVTAAREKRRSSTAMGYLWKVPAVLVSTAVVAFGAFSARDVIPWPRVWSGFVTQGDTRDAGKTPEKLPDKSADAGKPPDHPADDSQKKPDDQPSNLPAADTNTPPAADHPPANDAGVRPPKEAPHATALPAPLRLAEMRDPFDRVCVAVLLEDVAPRMTDVAMDGPDHFHDSAGRNLCALEWSLTPEAAQAAIQGFDIDLVPDPYGARMVKTGGAPGAWTKIRIEFKRDFSRAISYKVSLKFRSDPPKDQVQQFHHSIK